LQGAVGPQQVGRQFLAVDADGEVQGVLDDVLGEVKGRVQDVIAAGPADLDAVGSGDAFLAGGTGRQPFEVLGRERPRRRSLDAVADEGDTAGKETHDSLRWDRDTGTSQSTSVPEGFAMQVGGGKCAGGE